MLVSCCVAITTLLTDTAVAAGSKTQISRKSNCDGARACSSDRKEADDDASVKFPKKVDVFPTKSWQLQTSDPKLMDAGSKRVLNAKSDKFQGNIHKRGKVQDVSPKSSSKVAVGPIMLGFFLFVVVGSALLQIIRTATSGASLL
ncbi:TPA: hypothetical protein ACH3X2_008121 [Trebouxia sp. C0005]